MMCGEDAKRTQIMRGVRPWLGGLLFVACVLAVLLFTLHAADAPGTSKAPAPRLPRRISERTPGPQTTPMRSREPGDIVRVDENTIYVSFDMHTVFAIAVVLPFLALGGGALCFVAWSLYFTKRD